MKFLDAYGRDVLVPVDSAQVMKRLESAASENGLPIHGYNFDPAMQSVALSLDTGRVGYTGYRALKNVSVYIGDIITSTPRVTSPGLKTLII